MDGLLKGWRTLLWNGVVVAGGTAALQYFAGVNWVDYVGPAWAMAVVAGVHVALRFVTNTPVGVK